MAEVTLELIAMKLQELLKEVEGLQRETRNLEEIYLRRERNQVSTEKRLIDIEQRMLTMQEHLGNTVRTELKAGLADLETRLEQWIERRLAERRITSP